ncbi:MAG TPA: class II aldolase/adducin family protein, partial [Gammaproteobacteria bacterium]
MEPPENVDQALRESVVATARRMNAAGLGRGTAGNVSARTSDGFLVTPSGIPYEACQPGDVVA